MPRPTDRTPWPALSASSREVNSEGLEIRADFLSTFESSAHTNRNIEALYGWWSDDGRTHFNLAGSYLEQGKFRSGRRSWTGGDRNGADALQRGCHRDDTPMMPIRTSDSWTRSLSPGTVRRKIGNSVRVSRSSLDILPYGRRITPYNSWLEPDSSGSRLFKC